MKKFNLLTIATLALGTVVACSSPEKMAEAYESVVVTCEPAVLEVIAGNIDAEITSTFPAKYFNTDGILEVTPVLVYEGGEQALEPFTYQGEKVKDNYKVVGTDGAQISEKVHFTYVKGMEKATLELRSKASNAKKSVEGPTKKVADGCNTTYMLVDKKGSVSYKADGYQDVIKSQVEGQILYNICSAQVNKKELKGASVNAYQEGVKEAIANERKTITSTDIVAYASPDGKEAYNNKLSADRSKSAEKAYATVAKNTGANNPVNVKSIGEDWEGFQELVAASNIEDKELILRVLSMYSDPAVRESEIKNLSAVYQTLAKDVLPALRRARFIANVEYQNYSAEELATLVNDNIDVLDEPALLHAAALSKDNAQKEALYKKAIEKFSSDVAQYNLAVLYVKEGKYADAKAAAKKVENQDADLINLNGVIALNEGDLQAAAEAFAKVDSKEANNNAAVVDILNGNYEAAYAKLANCNCCCASNNKALACILTDRIDEAEAAIKCECPTAYYLKAIVAARKGNADGVKANLAEASKCECLAARATKDIEFARFN
ncbi:MAG: hypothetical protein HUJ95_06490 [Bacteroidales bacterium]|nr:hypothetical protein [Bacteroidales bacterium]